MDAWCAEALRVLRERIFCPAKAIRVGEVLFSEMQNGCWMGVAQVLCLRRTNPA
jgi:hypothetical protein